MTTRISRFELYMRLANVFALRSTCARGQVGCVLVRDNHMIGAGYNGAPPHMPECLDVGCSSAGVIATSSRGERIPIDLEGCTRAIHAEANAVAFSARHGVRTEGAVLYCTHGACRPCAQLLVSAGISAVYYMTPYRDTSGVDLLKEAGVVCHQS